MIGDSVIERAEPQPYLARLESYLGPVRNTDYYPSLLYSHTDIQHFNQYLSRLDPYLSLAGCSVLDMGSGTGGLLLACRQRGATHLVGIEVDPELHVLAQLRLVDTGIESLLTDGSTVPLPAATFDVIFSIHVIEHVVSPRVYLSEIARLLKPGGVVLLSCPNRLWPNEPHANLPFLSYLPVSTAKALCQRRSRSERLSEAIRRQYHTGTLLNHYFSFLGLRRLCGHAGLEFVEINSPNSFTTVEHISFGEWGKTHPRFEAACNLLNERFIQTRIGPYLRSHPFSRLARGLALTLNWEISGVLRKRTGKK
jgi:SAM-dependent methyltransferase